LDEIEQALWAEIQSLNLKAGDVLPVMPLVEKFMLESDFEPDEIAEGFEMLVEKGWLEERDDTAYLTAEGFAAL